MATQYAVARQTGAGGVDHAIIREFDSWQEAEDWLGYAANTAAYSHATLEIIKI